MILSVTVSVISVDFFIAGVSDNVVFELRADLCSGSRCIGRFLGVSLSAEEVIGAEIFAVVCTDVLLIVVINVRADVVLAVDVLLFVGVIFVVVVE